MSFELEDICSFYLTREYKAKKHRFCDGCHGDINKGDLYQKHVFIHDREFYTEDACVTCAVIIKNIQYMYGSHPSPGWLSEAFTENMDINSKRTNKTSPEVKYLRQHYAFILKNLNKYQKNRRRNDASVTNKA